MKRSGPKRSSLQREKDRATIARLVLQGKTQQEIGEYLELDQSMISREVATIRKEWKDSSLRDFDESRGRQLAKLELAERELWEAWNESKLAQEVKSTERTGLVNGEAGGLTPAKIRLMVREQTKPGEPTYLNAVVGCIREQNKLLGLYPQEVMGGQAINLTNDQLSVIGALMGQHNEPS